jgi:hypothetical protein
MESIQGIIVGAEVLGHLELPSDGAVEHATECDIIDRAGMDAEPYDPTRVLIHDDQHPVRTQRCRLAPEQVHTPEAVFHVAEERQPGWASRIQFRPVMNVEDAANHILVDCNAESQPDLLGDAGTTSVEIPPFQFNDYVDEFLIRSFRARRTPALARKQHAVLSFGQHVVEVQQRGWLQDDGGTQNACRLQEKGAQTGDDTLCGAQVGSTLAAAIEDA